MRNQSKGFSLIELLIVVAIILIIAAIAIPNLMRARISANESAAVGALRTINTTAVQYQSSYGVGFPPSLAELGPSATPAAADCATADLLDSILGQAGVPQKSGYKFTYAGVNPAVPPPGSTCNPGVVDFTAIAEPINVGVTGQRSFCIDHTGVVRQDMTGALINTSAAGCDNTAQVVQ